MRLKREIFFSTKPFKHYFYCLGVIAVLFSACTPERKLKETEYLLSRNKVTSDKKKNEIDVDEVVRAVRPQTNKRALGLFLWKASIYQAMIYEEKPRLEQFKRKMRNTLGQYPVLLDTLTNDYYAGRLYKSRLWLQKTLGEPPVLLDSSLIEYSLAQLKLMMQNMGYFNATVDYSVHFPAENKAKILYHITAGEPYRINQITYQISEPVDYHIYQDTARSHIKRGDIYSIQNLENQVERMERRLNNAGYWKFSRDYIRYDVDTNLGGQLLNINVVVSNPLHKFDDSTFEEGKHRCFIVNTVNVLYDFSQRDEFSPIDTVFYTEVVKKTNDTNNYLVLYPSNQRDYRPSALVYPIFFSQGDIYSNRSSRNTYDRYTDMRNFNFIRVSYSETAESKEHFRQDTGYLDCQIQLMRMKKKSVRFDLLGKNSGGILGTGAEFSYRNRNQFKAAEILSLSLKYTQELRVDSSSVNFKNFEIGGNLMLEFPRFLFPIKQQNISKRFRPRTWTSVGVNYVKREYYARFLTNLIFAYEWNERKNQQRITHSLSLLDFNLIKMDKGAEFQNFIDRTGTRKGILEKYNDHFLLGSHYRITLADLRRYVFKARFDLYGHTLYGAKSLFSKDIKTDTNQYVIWGIPFASGMAVDLDFTYNILQNRKSALVYHATLGVGLPTWNSRELPFEKSFYLGGSNSMRGWRWRALGPGSYVDTNRIDIEKVGDIKFETNIEFRQPIYKILRWALFVDAGNIWLMNKHELYPNGEFAFNRFFKEIAVDAGIGLHLDISFLVIRLDYAIKIHDPARENKWTFKDWNKFKQFSSDGSFVLGIGYAF